MTETGPRAVTELTDDPHPLDWYPDETVDGDVPPHPVDLPGERTLTSYALPVGLNLGQWLRIGHALVRMERAVMWWLGDWWRYGRPAYGKMASQAAKDQVLNLTGYTYTTITNAAAVAGSFEFSRRRENLPFAHHEAVASLDIDDADDLLDRAEAEQWTLDRLRKEARALRRMIRRERALAQPSLDFTPGDVLLLAADARALPWPESSVDLTVTSPPYGLGIGYEDGDVDADDWSSFVRACLDEIRRVTKPSGRLALNVPLDTSYPSPRPVYAEAVLAALAAGWEYRFSIIWNEGNTSKGNRSLGSVNSSARPHHVAPVEVVAVFSNGEWAPSADGEDDIDEDEWQAWGRTIWSIPGESRPWEGHPAPFPDELVRRLVRYLCPIGATVLDPFMGSGTTPLVAHRLGRRALGSDISEAYVASAQRRLAGA